MAYAQRPLSPENAEPEQLPPAEREFSVIYLDSEPLRASGWPMLRGTAVTLVALARDIGLTVCVPEPVEAELAAQFMRRFAGADEELAKGWRAIEGVFRAANAVAEGGPNGPNAGVARAAYERAVIAARQARQLVSVARSERPLGEYFELALRQSPPFDSEGRGFKDAVILMSVIDDLLRRRVAGLLVTRDTDFRGAQTLAESLGARLIVRNADEVIGILRRRLDASARESYANAERQALALVQRELATLGQFMTHNLEVPSSVLAERSEQLIAFLGVHIASIKGVQSDPPFSVLEPGQRAKLTFTFKVQLFADVMPIPETLVPATTVKVGDAVKQTTEPGEQLARLMVARQLRSQQGHKLVLRHAEVDAEAVRTVDGFEDLTLLVARLKQTSILEQIQDIMSPGPEIPNPAPPPAIERQG